MEAQDSTGGRICQFSSQIRVKQEWSYPALTRLKYVTQVYSERLRYMCDAPIVITMTVQRACEHEIVVGSQSTHAWVSGTSVQRGASMI